MLAAKIDNLKTVLPSRKSQSNPFPSVSFLDDSARKGKHLNQNMFTNVKT